MVDLTPWAPAIAVGGVAFGAILAFSGQFIASRTNKSIARVSRASDLRVDRQKAINDFIEAVQRARVLTSKFPIFGPILEHKQIADELQSVRAEVWFRLGCLEVVCRPAFYEVAAEYAHVVEETTLATVIDALMSEGELNLKLKSQVVRGPDGKPDLKIAIEQDPEFEKLNLIERKFFRAARKELYAADISD